MISMEIKKMLEHNISFICSNIFLISMEIIYMNWHSCTHSGIFVTLRGNVKLTHLLLSLEVLYPKEEKNMSIIIINASTLVI